MKLFEYQAKEIFSKYGINTPKGLLFEKPDFNPDLGEVGYPCVIKSQVLRAEEARLVSLNLPTPRPKRRPAPGSFMHLNTMSTSCWCREKRNCLRTVPLGDA